MKCCLMTGASSGDWFVTMMTIKAILAIWILIVPFMFLKRLDKLLKILEEKKK